MATKEIRGTEWTCNGCGATVLVAEGGSKPDGFHIPRVESWTRGCVAVRDDVWVCKPACIRKAVENALEDDGAEPSDQREEATDRA